MTYLFLYIAGITVIWWIYSVGWSKGIKSIFSILIPSLLIILFNIKAGRLIFRSPILGILSILPTTLIIYKSSQPLVNGFNNWVDRRTNEFTDSKNTVETEVISKEEV